MHVNDAQEKWWNKSENKLFWSKGQISQNLNAIEHRKKRRKKETDEGEIELTLGTSTLSSLNASLPTACRVTDVVSIVACGIKDDIEISLIWSAKCSRLADL